jgi:hypothetical protein
MFWQYAPGALFTQGAPENDATIVESLHAIEQATVALDKSLASWDGAVTSSFPILSASGRLLADLKARTEIARTSSEQTSAEGQECAKAVRKLLGSLEAVIDSTVAAREKAHPIIIRPVVLQLVKALRGAAADLSLVIVQQSPADMRAVMEALGRAVDEVFEVGVRAYS